MCFESNLCSRSGYLPMNHLGEQKAIIRNKIISQRKSLKNIDILEKSVIITQNLLALKQIARANNVLLYLPINGEVDTKYILAQFQEMKSGIFLPTYLKEDKRWVIAKFDSFDKLEVGPFKTLQPQAIHMSPISTMDLAIIPVVAFTKDLHRLGYGKGVYDKLLDKSNILRVGLAYDFQIVNYLPVEPHDVKMDYVVTEKMIYMSKSGNA